MAERHLGTLAGPMAAHTAHCSDVWLFPPAPSRQLRGWARERWVREDPAAHSALHPSITSSCCRLLITPFHSPRLFVPGAWQLGCVYQTVGSDSAHLDPAYRRFPCQDCRDCKNSTPPCLSCLFTNLAINNQGDLHPNTWLFIAPHI